MQTVRLCLLVSALAVGTFACGGEKKPAAAPENTGAETAGEDMPPPPSKEADDAKPAKTEGEGAAGGMIALAAFKIVPAEGKKGPSVELKADGTVHVDGKQVAKITGDQVNDKDGMTMLTVGVDGSLVGPGIKGGPKFEGDDLTSEGGSKVSIGDDGAISVTKDGKPEVVAKIEGDAKAKRAALILVTLWMSTPQKAEAKPAKKKK